MKDSRFRCWSKAPNDDGPPAEEGPVDLAHGRRGSPDSLHRSQVMNARALASTALVLTLAACEQQSQTLPFAADLEQATVRTITASVAAVITSAAGISLHFPAGTVSDNTDISVTPVVAPASLAASGSPASRSFRVEPEELVLGRPASVEIKVDGEIDPPRTWLASLVVVTADGVEEIGSTRVDLRAGLAEAAIRRLGTVAVVIPDPRAVFVTRSGDVQHSLTAETSNLLSTGTDSIVARCGGPAARCDGLSVSTSDNVAERVDFAAAVYPQLSGVLSIEGAQAYGEITLRSSVRLLLQSGATAESVEVHGLLRPTDATLVSEDASTITLTNVLVRVSGRAGSEEGAGTIRTLVIQKSGEGGFVTFSRSFQLHDENDGLENASVDITIPVRIYQ